ncbi:MAG: ABC transporter ATP-binding protein [Acholeplasmatales bacterium]|jgi:putative ABC transport system ATP-binding protein|nr:ABC transporter ATP-binding protein [Acholeplasmataceae bacterium]MCK9289927.1 ABC transporter ATP-binding protein [Acholeplasmataceae bacterium]MCK9428235.1 ABC transporter ATP-binding protein [Acholeplasmataceae bacterium]MDY0115343.1 ABC transporter ATP-binding protein [Acholeplasmatales bacterium]HHT39316.1 ABC transporter ATP-binding protein [Acholeplasmataceae bacterium]
MKTLIEMINVTKDFLQGDNVINALKTTNFKAYEGELIAIVGPSGSGKSTFLTILGGLQRPTTGRVLLNGKPFSELDVKEKSKIRLEEIGFILQASNLIPFLTVKEQMVLYNKITKSKVDEKWIDELFSKLTVEKLRNKYPNELSGGERQRVAIAKALYHQPNVIFADEPTASLDTKKAFDVVKLLAKETKEQKKATIMVTHDERMLEFCDRVYVIVDGVLTER